MKKLLFTFLSAFMISTSLSAWDRIPLTQQGDIDDEPIGHNGPKSPTAHLPMVYIEDYTLLFESNHPEYVLNIKDEDGDVVYTTTVYSNLTQIVLPSILTGDYEIELIMGNWKFIGNINL